MTSGPIDLGAVRRKHRHFVGAFDNMVDQALRGAGERGVRYAETHPRFTPRSPQGLAKSNEYKLIRTGQNRLLRLRNRKKYAAAIDKGARPHIIRPRGGHYLNARLAFFWPKVGKWVFPRQVHHPGNKPYRFLHSAHKVSYKYAGKRLRDGMKRLAQRF